MAKELSLDKKIQHYWNIAQLCKTTKQKITFFEENQEAFNLDPDAKEDSKNEYWNKKGMDDDDIEEFEESALLGDGYPDEYKIFAFDFLISTSKTYSQMSKSSLEEIVNLITPEDLQEKLDEGGISYNGSEAEDEVMFILERRAKKKGCNISEDDLEAATKIAIQEMRDWIDDNYETDS